MKKDNISFFNYFRTRDWIHYLGYTLFGSLLAHNFNIFNFLDTVFLLAYAYSINDYYDKKMKKKCFLIPLILFFLILPFLSYFSASISLSFLILFTLYSWPKVWLEGRPILSTITNSIGFTLIFILPMNSMIIFQYCLLVLLIFTLNTAAQLLHEIVDSKKDKKIKKITTTVRFGVKTALILFKLCLFSAMVISALIFSKFPLISLSSIIFSLIFVLIKSVKRKTRKKFRIFGIIFGVVYMIELLKRMSELVSTT